MVRAATRRPDEHLAHARLYRWGRWLAVHRIRVLAVWLVLLAGAGALTPRFLSGLTGATLSVSGSGSRRAQRLLRSGFGDGYAEQDLVVFSSRRVGVGDPAFHHAVTATLDALSSQPAVASVVSPYQSRARSRLVATGGHTAIALVGLRGNRTSRQAASPHLQEVVQGATSGPVEADLTGASPVEHALVRTESHDVLTAETIGIPVALVVLLLAFGTVVAAGLPLALGFTGLLLAFGVLGLASTVRTFEVFVESVATMLALALGIDYSLLLVTRFREELASGLDVIDAVGVTMGTAGKAVLFSGTTVLVSMAALLLVRSSIFVGMSLGAVTAVLCLLLATTTLLPALLALLGHQVNRLALPWARRRIEHPDPDASRWGRWARGVMRHPVVATVVAAGVLLVAVVPVLGLRLGVSIGANAVTDRPAGRGLTLLANRFPPGVVTPVEIVVHRATGPFDGRDLQAIDRLARAVRHQAPVSQVTSLPGELRRVAGGTLPAEPAALLRRVAARIPPPLLDRSSSTTVVDAVLSVPADSRAATGFVGRLRDRIVPRAVAGTGLRVAVGGTTARIVDIDAETARTTPLVVGVVLACAFLLLLLAFRSLAMPAKAVAMNLLSVGAAYGLLVAVFQWGWGQGLLGFTSPGYLQVYLPLLTYAVLFGLSMDYEVFLVSRIKEEWGRTRDNTASVAGGLTRTARVITAAAAIMVVIFASFTTTKVLELQEMGFALAVAVLVDATVVRLVLVPALMRLLGRWNWWLPGWLTRRLPHVSLTEGSPARP